MEKYIIKLYIKNNLFNIYIVIPYGCQALIELPNKKKYFVGNGEFNYKCKINEKYITQNYI